MPWTISAWSGERGQSDTDWTPTKSTGWRSGRGRWRPSRRSLRTYAAFDGAAELLNALRPGTWAVVTSNYEHRVRGRFARTGLPVPEVLVDAAAVEEGKPSPVPYLQAAARLDAKPEQCLVIEDAPSGVQSGLRAGMTVWGVNTPAAVNGVHRHFGSLREAARDILAFVSGLHPHRLEGPATVE